MNSYITIENREKLTISDAVSVTSITDAEAKLYTESGDIVIKGSGLHADEFSADGKFVIEGHIISLAFATEKHHLPDNIISRLFR